MNETRPILKTTSTRVHFEAPNLVVLVIKSGEMLTVEESKVIAQWALSLTDGAKFKLLTIPEEHATVDSDVREFLGSDNRQERVLADAMVINNLPHKLLADFYVRFNRPKIPTRFFETEAEAREWIEAL